MAVSIQTLLIEHNINTILSWDKQDPVQYGLVEHGNIETLPDFYQKYENVLVMIHAAGHPACHTGNISLIVLFVSILIYYSAYEIVREASYILSDYEDFKIVAVDCARGPLWGKVCYNYGVHSYPDFRFFKSGEQGGASKYFRCYKYINRILI